MLISNVWCFLYQFFSGENKVKITPKVNNAHTLLYVLLKSRCLPTCQKKERASKVGKRTMGTMPIKPLYNSKFSWLFRGEVCVHRNASKTSTFSLTCCWQAGTKSSDCNKFTEILFFFAGVRQKIAFFVILIEYDTLHTFYIFWVHFASRSF